ncbi:MAG TPA: LamG-like jellyroll fold domain-containing protein, partial [Polyangiaceae bacterium]|nr:LamG-like jellyroll fold domain-containing protein [Polyangiaceae bacterium]
MRTVTRVSILSLTIGSFGCSVDISPSEQVGRAADSVGVSAEAVLGFENVSLWSGPGQLVSSSDHTEGAASLAVRPVNYSFYQSVRFTQSGKPRQIALDAKLPAIPANTWPGYVQLFVESHSKGLFNAYVGQVALSGRPRGEWTTLTFDVPESIAAKLAGGVEDLRVRIGVNIVGFHGTFSFDNLRMRTELLLHYRFDQLTEAGTVLDSSGYGRHGALQGAAALSAGGRAGSALELDGATGYLQIPDGVISEAAAMTVAAWVKLDEIRPWARIFDFGGANGFAYLTASTHDARARYSAFAGFTNEGTLTGPALPAGAWKHVALTTTGRDYRLFVDGVEAANALTVPVAPRDIGANVANWIGRSRFPDPLLDGRIDDFRIYERVLTQAEIAALAHPGQDYANWRFDDGSSATVKDSSDLHLNGVVSGSTTPVAGLIGGARQLNGTGGHVRLPAGIVAQCQDLTVSAWVKLRSNRPWNRVFDFGKPDASSFMYLSPAGFGPQGQELRFGLIAPTGVHDIGYPFQLPLSEWNHLAVVLRGDQGTLFLNGRAVTRQSGVVANPSDMGQTIANFFGRSTFAADASLDGALDDYRLSCRAYADNEIAQLAHLPAPAVLPNQVPVTGAIRDVHDPSMIEAAGTFYLFSTGPGLMLRTSADLNSWAFNGSVFAQNPAWVTERIGAIDSLWAPDISFFNGTYHLYYSASTFGSNHSCIGHATKADLAAPEPWTDHGPVICSNDGGSVDDFNAIDPNVVLDQAGTPWLSFGSFWGGIQLIRLDSSGARADSTVTNIASRPTTEIEAPYIVYRTPYYYLFSSF